MPKLTSGIANNGKTTERRSKEEMQEERANVLLFIESKSKRSREPGGEKEK